MSLWRIVLTGGICFCSFLEAHSIVFKTPHGDLEINVKTEITKNESNERVWAISAVIDKSDCCEGPIDLELVINNGQSMRVTIPKDEISVYQTTRLGSMNPGSFKVKLENVFLKKPENVRLYTGVVADDQTCMVQAIHAFNSEGLQAHKEREELFTSGCLKQMEDTVITLETSPRILAGQKIVKGFWIDSDQKLVSGLILAKSIRSGVRVNLVPFSGIETSGEYAVTND